MKADMATLPHILVVDDDERLRDLLQQYLSDHGFFVSVADSAASARQMRLFFAFDAMVLDVMMPQETGLQFVASLPNPKPPVLMLTAMGDPQDRIRGLEMGADDYLVKPFEPRELVLRLRNLIERKPMNGTPPAPKKMIRFGGFVFDLEQSRLLLQGEPVYLTQSEALCLKLLAQHKGKPISREVLAELTSGLQEKNNERSVDVLINRLRKKIEPSSGRPLYIQTVRGAGYVLQADES